MSSLTWVKHSWWVLHYWIVVNGSQDHLRYGLIVSWIRLVGIWYFSTVKPSWKSNRTCTEGNNFSCMKETNSCSLHLNVIWSIRSESRQQFIAQGICNMPYYSSHQSRHRYVCEIEYCGCCRNLKSKGDLVVHDKASGWKWSIIAQPHQCVAWR